MERPPTIVLISGGLLAAIALAAFLVPSSGASAPDPRAIHAEEAANVSAEEADAWAEARAADTPGAYRVYLAAYPRGAFTEQAYQALDGGSAQSRAPARALAAAPAPAPVQYRPSAAEIASDCRAYVDRTLPPPSRVARVGGGAAGGCAIGLLAGGDDGRNCAIGAVAGGATGALTVQGRERRRREEVQACIANGGPG